MGEKKYGLKLFYLEINILYFVLNINYYSIGIL